MLSSLRLVCRQLLPAQGELRPEVPARALRGGRTLQSSASDDPGFAVTPVTPIPG